MGFFTMLAIGAVTLLMLVTAITGTLGAYAWFNRPKSSNERLQEMTGVANASNRPRDEAVDKIAQRLSALANPANEDERSKLRQRMVQAGYTSRHALEWFSATRVALAVVLPLLVVPAVLTGASVVKIVGGVVFVCAIGYYLPAVVLTSQLQNRQKRLLKPFPDAMDLLVSSVEAGLGLDAAFRRVADEMESAAPELAKEFQLVNHEISAGVTRQEALRHLAGRTGLEEVSSLVNMLTQAERFGTSIARSLRIHSSMTRQKRMSRAEEEAAKVSPKLTVVMILFLLPCLVMMLMGPAAINVINSGAFSK